MMDNNKIKCTECGYEFLLGYTRSKRYCSNACAHVAFTKWVLTNNKTREEWIDFSKNLQTMGGVFQLLIGDWARAGEQFRYTKPERYNELEAITGIKRRTIQQYKSVSAQVISTRRPDLPFSHHREVAYLPSELQSKFLERARKENMSVRHLRREVKKVLLK